jgi:hypothetical protein
MPTGPLLLGTDDARLMRERRTASVRTNGPAGLVAVRRTHCTAASRWRQCRHDEACQRERAVRVRAPATSAVTVASARTSNRMFGFSPSSPAEPVDGAFGCAAGAACTPTVTVNVVVGVFPSSAEVASHVTVVVPILNVEPEAGVQVTVASTVASSGSVARGGPRKTTTAPAGLVAKELLLGCVINARSQSVQTAPAGVVGVVAVFVAVAVAVVVGTAVAVVVTVAVAVAVGVAVCMTVAVGLAVAVGEP